MPGRYGMIDFLAPLTERRAGDAFLSGTGS
jgi:hypothetical protein